MTAPPRAILSWLSFLVVAWLWGCAPEAAPELLEVREVGPATLEVGSRLEIRGSGFPERASGRVRLVGTVFAPAREAERVDLTFPALAESRSRIEVALTAERLARLTEGAAHGTFRGRISVEFEARTRSGPVLRGEGPDVVLDVFASRASAPDETGVSFAEFLGLELGEGLEVVRVEGDSEGARAGLLPGDRLHALDGVRLDGRADFLPGAGLRVSSIEFSRAGHEGFGTALVDRSDFQPLAGALAGGALAVVVGLAFALVLSARPPRFLVWLVARRGRPGERSSRSPFEGARFFLFLAVVLAFWFALGVRSFLWSAIDLEIALGLVVSSGIAAAFLSGGRRARAPFSLVGALYASWLAVLAQLPLVLASVLCASERGTLRLADLARLQGEGPFEFAWIESPAHFALGLAVLGALVPRNANARTRFGFREFFEAVSSFGTIGLWVILFAGGAEGLGASNVVGSLVLGAKMATVVVVVAFVRARLGELRLDESASVLGRGTLGLALLGVASHVAFRVSGVAEIHGTLVTLGMRALVIGLVVFLALAVPRALAHRGRALDPWI